MYGSNFHALWKRIACKVKVVDLLGLFIEFFPHPPHDLALFRHFKVFVFLCHSCANFRKEAEISCSHKYFWIVKLIINQLKHNLELICIITHISAHPLSTALSPLLTTHTRTHTHTLSLSLYFYLSTSISSRHTSFRASRRCWIFLPPFLTRLGIRTTFLLRRWRIACHLLRESSLIVVSLVRIFLFIDEMNE